MCARGSIEWRVAASFVDEVDPQAQERTEPPPQPGLWRMIPPTLAGVIVCVFALAASNYVARAHWGVDQNAYLFAGRLVAEYRSPAFTRANPHQFLGMMFVQAPNGRSY